MIKKKTSLIYVNFSPYENAGKILDFILDNFETVAVFSFNFHKLGKSQKKSNILVYKKKKIIYKQPLYQLPMDIPLSFVFLLLPIRSFIIFIQVCWYSQNLKRKYGKFEIYFTVNAFTAWIGNVLRKFHVVSKTIFWVWDYYPPLHGSSIVNLMRWLYWQYDKASLNSDKVVYLNNRLVELRKDIGILPREKEFPIVPIGTDVKSHSKKKTKSLIIGMIGVQKKSQGLDIVFDNDKLLKNNFPELKIEIIGSGPDEGYFRKRVKKSVLTPLFHGFIPQSNDVDKIVSTWDIGIAPYVPEASNVIYYTDPSKIKYYFSFAIPVIVTNVFKFSEEIEKHKAGVVINYDGLEFLNAIKKVKKNYLLYKNNAKKLGMKYHYKKIYPELFRV